MIDTNALRKKVLDLAIRGKLVPQNPNDEPASVLLERIREEKQRLIREGKIKKDKVDSVIFRGDDNCHYEKIGNNEPVLLEDLPFEIPDSWSWVRFSSLIKVISGVSYDKHDVCNKGIRILRGGNINNFNVSLEDDDVFLPDRYYDEEKQVKVNDILIVASTGSKLAIGKAGFVIANLENTQIGAFLRIVRPLFEEFAEYIKTIFATNYYKEHILDSIRGSNINNLKNEHISNLLIPVPPIEEQLRITKYIKEVFVQIDLVEKNQSDYNSLVESLKKAILQSAIQGKLVEQNDSDESAIELLARIRAEKKAQLGKKYVESYIYKGVDNRYYEHIGDNDIDITEEIPYDLPKNWCFTRLNEYLDVRDGTHDSPKYCESGYPLVTSKNLSNGAIDFSTAKMISEKDYIAINERSFVDNNDILFAMIGSIGNPVLVKKDRDFAIKNMALFKQRTLIQNMEYMLYYSTYIQDSLRRKTSGALQPFISLNFFRNLIIPIPPLAEQERIVSKINEIFAQL